MSGAGLTQVTRVVTKGSASVRMVQRLRLSVVSGPDAGRTAEVATPLFRIGTHETNDFALKDGTVSKHHLEVHIVPEGYRLVDLSSSNGTYLGALRLGEVTISDEAVLQLGQTTLKLLPEGKESEVPASDQSALEGLLGRSLAMRELYVRLEAVSQSDCSVLLEGETGVGKERVAETIHARSSRKKQPFVVVDCAALSSELFESELFGHVRGAFSGAMTDRTGLLVQAHGGTVFLDEVGELPLAQQVKLLGALERRRVQPVGSSQARDIDVRVLGATHRDLARDVNQGRFRADLFYRLAVVRLRVPPLRERLEDIPLLVSHFLAELREREGDAVPSELSALTLGRLSAQPWPGNVRELKNAVERSVLNLPAERAERNNAPLPFLIARANAVENFQRSYFNALLQRAGGNLSQVARAAGMDRRYLYRILERLGLHAPREPQP